MKFEVGKKYASTYKDCVVYVCLWTDDKEALFRSSYNDETSLCKIARLDHMKEVRPKVRRTFYLNLYQGVGYGWHSSESDAKSAFNVNHRAFGKAVCRAFPVTVEVEEGYGLSEASACSVGDTK